MNVYDLKPEAAILTLILCNFDEPIATKEFPIKIDQNIFYISFDGNKYSINTKENKNANAPNFQNIIKSSDENASENIKEITEKIEASIAKFINVEFHNFTLCWGVNEGSEPVLISFDELKCQTDKSFGTQTSDLILLSFSEKIKKSSSKCYIDSGKCGIANLSMERSKILEYKIYQIISKCGTSKRKRAFNEAIGFVKSLVPEIFKGSVRVCPMCYRMFSRQPTELHKQTLNRPLTSSQNFNRTTTRPSTSYERPQTVTINTRAPENKPIITPSGLRMSQNFSGHSYQLAHKLYGPHVTPFSPYLKRPQKKF